MKMCLISIIAYILFVSIYLKCKQKYLKAVSLSFIHGRFAQQSKINLSQHADRLRKGTITTIAIEDVNSYNCIQCVMLFHNSFYVTNSFTNNACVLYDKLTKSLICLECINASSSRYPFTLSFNT